MAIKDDLISYWKLDETSGVDADDAHGAHDGTYVNSPTLAETGKIGTAVTFSDTTNTYMTVVNHADFKQTAAFSYGGWFKSTDTTQASIFCSMANRVIGQYAGTYIDLNEDNINDGSITFQIGSVDGAPTEVRTKRGSGLNDGAWHHVIATYDGTHGRIYIDGSLSGAAAAMDAPAYNVTNYVGISAWIVNAAHSHQMDGTIDEIGYWKKELTSTEISDLYNSGDGLAYPFVAVYTDTNAATDVNHNSATLNGELTEAGGETVSLCFRYREQGGSWEADIEVETGVTSPQVYDYNLTGLDPETTYEFQAVVKWGAEEETGSILDFTTEAEPPAPYEYKPVYSKIEIGGTDYADALKITVDRTIGDFNAASNFTAEFDNHHGQYSDTFNLNDEVVIYADRGEKPTTKIFAGVIENISFKGDTEREKINLVGRDYCAILQDMTVKPIIFKDADAGQIAKTIMLNNTEDLLTGNHMNTSTGVTIEKIGFNHKIVFEALKKLAELSDCYFYVDADKDVHFIKKGDIISGLTFNNTNVHDGTFKKTDREIYNKVYVYGARVLTGAKDTGGTWGAGETGSVFRLNDKPHNTNVTVDGVLQYPGGIVGMTDPATEPGLKYLVGFNEKQIIFVSGTAAGENIPSSGTSNVTVEYEKYSPLLKYLEDETSVTDYGPKTKIIKDDSFKSYSETSNEATKFLENNKDPKIQGDLDIKGLVDVTPGNTCVVDLPWHGISEQTYTILSASYTFNKYNNLADNVLHITLNKKISDFTDIMKEQMLKTKTIDVGTLEGEYTTLATATADLSIESHFEIYTKDINSNFIFHSEKHGKLEDPNSRIGTGVLGSTLFASGGEY